MKTVVIIGVALAAGLILFTVAAVGALYRIGKEMHYYSPY